MQINHFGGNVFGVTDGNTSFTVAFLPRSVAIYGTCGHQFFNNPENVPPDRIAGLFHSKASLLKAAALHTDKTTNKTKLLACLDKALANNIIDMHNRNTVRDFVLRCDCQPSAIKRKLASMGYERLLPHLDFEDERPELTATINAMENFIAGLAALPTAKKL